MKGDDFAIRGLPDDQLRAGLNDLIDRFESGVDKIMNNYDVKYIKSLIDPFSSDAVGARIPALNPVATYTHTQFDSF